MNKLLIIGLVVGLLPSCLGDDAYALPLTYEIAGKITSVIGDSIDIGMAVGDTFKGSLIYDNCKGASHISFLFNNSTLTTVSAELEDPYGNFNYFMINESVSSQPNDVRKFEHIVDLGTGQTLPEYIFNANGRIFMEFYTPRDNLLEKHIMHFTVAAPSPVPEPATMFLFCTGFIGLVGATRKVIK